MKKHDRTFSGKKLTILFFASVFLSVAFLALCIRFLTAGYFFIAEILCVVFSVTSAACLFRDVKLTRFFVVLSAVFPVSSVIFAISAILYKCKTERKQKFVNFKNYERKDGRSGIIKTSFSSGQYYSSGEEFFSSLFRSVENAKRRIYLEYYIVKPGKVWERIKKTLEKKSSEKVEIIMILDNFGCSQMTNNLQKWLKSHNIDCFLYNKLLPLPDLGFTFRTHRKVAVIDDEVFISGANVADEYINEDDSFPFFKDCAIGLNGQIADDLADCFLSFKKLNKRSGQKIATENPRLPVTTDSRKTAPCEIAFNTPLFAFAIKDKMLEEIYKARRVYISTPYLAPTDDLTHALIYSARRGAEIKIFLPGVPDKKAAFAVSEAIAEKLSAEGIKIYLFTPGFLHSKLFLTENVFAVGSANADYRSAFFQREISVFIKNETLFRQIKNDFSFLEKSSAPFCRKVRNNKFRALLHKIKTEFLDFVSPLF